ncbi:MAG: bifunctional diaminohydroxyphosphoribosylaminopyrimidine deaminase/5-amino-6-(5-phosphoribosylamino)uracil reductase RibD [Thermoflavifilum sp.]|nr:bifunctional diaminohydroxyphosphoribosylaminopyrimidine deaminase/5-amino-6-(5-phosphoribosylamino)uracil reductase RibD [Thermoflavifilum sp.]
MDIWIEKHELTADERWMLRALQLAVQAAGNVAPNPMVGAVLVYREKIIGEGYHAVFGGPHAEVNAVHAVPKHFQHLLPESTLYVNLEPCAHVGKTPPCTDLIISKRIPRVVIGISDPNPQVAGKGISHLKQAGIEVHTNVLEKSCRWVNRRFLTFHQYRRPYVILKWAQSKDGYLAPANRTRLTLSDLYTAYWVHRWRAEEAAILVGAQTAISDNPMLNNRYWWPSTQALDAPFPRLTPVRMVIDPHLRVPQHVHLFDQSMTTWIFNYHKTAQQGSTYWIAIDRHRSVVEQVLEQAFQNGIQSIIVEGGEITLQHFIDADCWDEARIIYTKKLIGSGIPAPLLTHATWVTEQQCGSDLICWFQHTQR